MVMWSLCTLMKERLVGAKIKIRVLIFYVLNYVGLKKGFCDSSVMFGVVWWIYKMCKCVV